MKMKTLMGLAMMVTALVAATANAAVPEVLTYRGQLSRTGGFAERGENLTLTFKIYDSAAPATVLWGRSVVASVDSNGVFYAELKDDNGAAVQGATYTALVDAVAAAKGAIEVGLTPPGAGEITPRQTLTTGVRAARAARTKAVDIFYAQNRIMAESAAIDELIVNSVTVTNGSAQLPPVCYLEGLSPARSAWPYVPASQGCYMTPNASCDMVLTYENDEGAFSVILPKGCRVDGSSTTQVRTVNATAFGTPR